MYTTKFCHGSCWRRKFQVSPPGTRNASSERGRGPWLLGDGEGSETVAWAFLQQTAPEKQILIIYHLAKGPVFNQNKVRLWCWGLSITGYQRIASILRFRSCDMDLQLSDFRAERLSAISSASRKLKCMGMLLSLYLSWSKRDKLVVETCWNLFETLTSSPHCALVSIRVLLFERKACHSGTKLNEPGVYQCCTAWQTVVDSCLQHTSVSELPTKFN